VSTVDIVARECIRISTVPAHGHHRSSSVAIRSVDLIRGSWLARGVVANWWLIAARHQLVEATLLVPAAVAD
jgi:hypothetical protein